MATAPVLLVFCNNNRRQRRIHDLRGHPFANDHLDWFVNASVDAAIVLAAFVLAAQSVGLAACPISASAIMRPRSRGSCPCPTMSSEERGWGWSGRTAERRSGRACRSG
jgi:nitroreductase